MKKIVVSLILSFLLFVPAGFGDKIPFQYDIKYYWDGDLGTYYGYNGAVFNNVPVVYSNQHVNFTFNISSERNLKDIRIILIQEYYCETTFLGYSRPGYLLFNCTSPNFEKMTGNSVFIYNYSEINKGQKIILNGTYYPGGESFSSLDRTHLIVMHCPNNYCEAHWEDFWNNYHHIYYNSNHLNKTILSNDDWKYFKWGKIILDDPLAGIWCAK